MTTIRVHNGVKYTANYVQSVFIVCSGNLQMRRMFDCELELCEAIDAAKRMQHRIKAHDHKHVIRQASM
jgi:hypothetical protein